MPDHADALTVHDLLRRTGSESPSTSVQWFAWRDPSLRDAADPHAAAAGEPDPVRPRWLLTDPGMGYRFQPDPDDAKPR